ncbi:MAG: hypothetical protein KF690_08145 [Bacteroidetes bacterium]|nr:hypothetical protein [Bacteroidota bacterium]
MGAFAQNNWLVMTSTVPADLTVCAGSRTYNLTITNSHSAVVENTLLTITLPTGVRYVAGSAVAGGVTESNITNLGAPVLAVPDLAAGGGSVSINFQAIATCDHIAFANAGNPILLSARANYTGGFDVHSSNQWNALFPSLSISNITNQTFSGVTGSTFTRTYTIINGGNGALSSPVVFVISNGVGLVRTSATTPAGTDIGSNHVITISDFTPYGNGNALLETGETIIITENLRIVNCSQSLVSNYTMLWGCYSQTCQQTVASGNIVIPPNPPVITIASTQGQSSCFDIGNANAQELRLTNTGTGPATNFTITLWQDNNNATTLDTASLTYRIGVAATPAKPVITQLVASTLTANRTCLSGNPYGATRDVTFVIPQLPAGQTLYINFNIRNCCGSSPGATNRFGRWGWSGTWEDQCQQNNYQQLSNTRFDGVTTTQGASFSQAGPNDLTSAGPGCFRVEIGNDGWAWVNTTPNVATVGGYLEWRVALPPNTAYVAGSMSFVDFDGTVWAPAPGYPTVSGGVVISRYLLPNTGNRMPAGWAWTGSYIQYCLQTACGVSAANQALNTQMLMVPDPTCPTACALNVLSATRNINVICPDPCTNGGMNNLSYLFRRRNLGLRDSDLNGIPEAGAPNPAQIRRDRLFLGDTLETRYRAVVVTTAANPTWTRGFASVTLSNGARYTPLPATLRIWDASAGVYRTCTVTPAVTNTGGNSRRYDYTISPAVLASGCSTFTGFVFENGDSVQLDANFRLTTNIGFASEALVTTANEFFLSNTGVVTSTALPAAASRFSCNGFTGSATYYGGNVDQYSSGNTTYNGCQNTQISYTVRSRIGAETWGDYFPYEIRNFNAVDSIVTTLPVGWTYAGSAEIQYRYVTGPSVNVLIAYQPITPVVSGNTIRFYPRPFFASQGGPFPLAESYELTVRYRVLPSCLVPTDANSVAQRVTMARYTGWIASMATLAASAYSASNSSLQNSLFFNRPDLQLTSVLPTVEAIDSLVTWDIVIGNGSGLAAMPNTWFALQLPPTLSLRNVTDLGTMTVVNPVSGLYQLGTVNTGATRSFRIRARLLSCTTDSIRVTAGWNCSGYPASVAAYPCTPAIRWLKSVPLPAELQVVPIVEPSGSVDLCGEVEYVIEVRNVQPGASYNNYFYLINPAGGGIVPVPGSVQVLYPLSGTYQSIPNPSVLFGGQLIAYDISHNVPSIAAGGLRGVRQPTQNAYRIRFRVETNCSYISGGRPRIYAAGTMPCGSSTYNYYTTHNLNITGANTNYNAAISEVSLDTLRPCGDASTIRCKVVNLGPAITGSNDNFRFFTDEHADYQMGSFQALHNAPTTVTPVSTVVSGRRELIWDLPAGVAPGDSILFSFELDAMGVPCGPQEYEVVTTVSSSLICTKTGLPCQVNTTTASLLDTMVVRKAQLALVDYAVTWHQRDSVVFMLDYRNTAEPVLPGHPITFNFFHDINQNGRVDGLDASLGSNTYLLGLNHNQQSLLHQNSTYFAPMHAVLPSSEQFIIRAQPPQSCLCDTFFVLAANSTVLGEDDITLAATQAPEGGYQLRWRDKQPQLARTYSWELLPETASGNIRVLGTLPSTGQTGVYVSSPLELPVGTHSLRIHSTDHAGAGRVSNTVRLVVAPRACPVWFNPAQPAVVFRCMPEDAAPTALKVYNTVGQQVFAVRLGAITAGQQVPLPNLARGTYLIQADYSDGSQHTQKVIY